MQRAPGGKLKRNTSGKLVRNSSTSSATCCCSGTAYRALACCDDSFEDFWITGVSLPYFFKKDGTCYYAGSIGTPGEGATVWESGDVTEYDSCDDCTGIADCVPCAVDPDPGCCGTDPCGNAEDTPDEFTVTFSGIAPFSGCIISGDPPGGTCEYNPTATPPYKVTIDSWSGGTYTLPRVGDCQWELDSTGPTVRWYDGSSCDTETNSENGVNIRLQKFNSPFFWALWMRHDTLNHYIFYTDAQTAVNTDEFSCCRENTIINRIDATTPCDWYSGGELVWAAGGQAVVTPC
jgi:hypothetical protein